MAKKKYLSDLFGFFATLPFRYKRSKVETPKHVGHKDWPDYLSANFNKKGLRVLEIGSRNVTGANLRGRFNQADYLGFDYYPGENVDIAGDAHKLSSYFPNNQQFDLIFSSAVFEHFHMPWVVALEIQKMLKVGGYVFVETHFSFSAHERPWNFFQFSDLGLRVLFNEALGFELVDSGMSNPIGGYFTPECSEKMRYKRVRELYCHSEILCRKHSEVKHFSWDSLSTDQVLKDTTYPPPRLKSSG